MAQPARSKLLIASFIAGFALSLLAQAISAQPQRQATNKPPLTVIVLGGETPLANPLSLLLEIKVQRDAQANTLLSPEQFQVFVIPHGRDLSESEWPQWQASGVFVTHLHRSYFLDVRQLPVQLFKGDCDLVVRVTEDGRRLAEARVENAIRYTFGGRDIAILLDESADAFRDQRVISELTNALHVFSDPRSATTKLCTVSFGVKTRILLPPTRPSEKERLSKALSMIGGARPANIAEAVRLASTELAASPGEEKMLILLANQTDDSRAYEDACAQLKEKGWAIRTIDPSAPPRTMGADENSQHALKRAFEEICLRLRTEQTVWAQRVAAPLNGEKAFDVQIDSSIRSVTFACDSQATAPTSEDQKGPLTRQRSSGVRLTLTDTQGNVVADSTPAERVADIHYPTHGSWRSVISEDPNHPTARPLLLNATADTALSLRPIPSTKDYAPG